MGSENAGDSYKSGATVMGEDNGHKSSYQGVVNGEVGQVVIVHSGVPTGGPLTLF